MADDKERKLEQKRLFSWGANSHGQLCLGHKEDVLLPKSCSESDLLENVVISSVTGGGGHTAVITETQDLLMCGWNSKGQLGLGDTEDRVVLCHVQGFATVKQVSCGWSHTLATTDAGLYVWGSNAFGQLGTGKLSGYITRPTLCWEFTNKQVISVAAGLRHSVVALADGSVWCWGSNKKGQLGLGKLGSNNTTPQQVLFPDSAQIIQVEAGCHHSAAVTATGQVFCWGSNQHGQCGRPPEHDSQIFTEPQLIGGLISDLQVTKLKSGWSHLLAITDGKVIYSWGRADYGQLGVDGDVVQQGFCCKPIELKHIKGAKQVVSGAEHNMALLSCGSVMTWGWNEHGICGTGNELNIYTPGLLPLLKDASVHVIGCGGGHSFAVIN